MSQRHDDDDDADDDDDDDDNGNTKQQATCFVLKVPYMVPSTRKF